MAAVVIPPSPHAIGTMTTRRVALAENPNLGNSPYHRNAITPVKRARSQSNLGDNTPPNKKQLFEDRAPKTPTRRSNAQARLERKAHLERQPVGRTAKNDHGETENQSLESVLQWQRHYKKIFPSYIFYFENIPEENRRRHVKVIESLGAHEVKFFSKDVTHVITTRPIPTDKDINQHVEAEEESASQQTDQPQTINPSLLNRTTERSAGLPRTKFSFDLATSRKAHAPPLDLVTRKPPVAKGDILHKAKELNIKIWHFEKLDRVLNAILTGSQSGGNAAPRGNAVARPSKAADLSQMIKDEQAHERGDREMNAAATEMVKLSGPYLYIRDMNEKTKPILVREYPRADKKENGEWPQFRSVATGRCPFVEEESHAKRVKEYREEKARRALEAKAKVEATAQARPPPMMQPPILQPRRDPLAETSANRVLNPLQLPPPPGPNDSTFTKGHHEHAQDPRTRYINGEPAASGMQPSNITSAIRSQMISSTAAVPGIKAGTSREIHGLQRKAVERNVGLHQSQRMTNIHEGIGRAVMTRPARREPVVVKEEEDEDHVGTSSKARSNTKDQKKEERPGYCENCREKYNDFDEHIMSRKHKKFATDPSNWEELDQLLVKLVRPLKSDVDYGYETFT